MIFSKPPNIIATNISRLTVGTGIWVQKTWLLDSEPGFSKICFQNPDYSPYSRSKPFPTSTPNLIQYLTLSLQLPHPHSNSPIPVPIPPLPFQFPHSHFNPLTPISIPPLPVQSPHSQPIPPLPTPTPSHCGSFKTSNNCAIMQPRLPRWNRDRENDGESVLHSVADRWERSRDSSYVIHVHRPHSIFRAFLRSTPPLLHWSVPMCLGCGTMWLAVMLHPDTGACLAKIPQQYWIAIILHPGHKMEAWDSATPQAMYQITATVLGYRCTSI